MYYKGFVEPNTRIDALEFVTRWEGVEGTYELVEGRVVALGPCTLGHARVNANLLVATREQLRGTGCTGFGHQSLVRTRAL